MGLVIIRVRIYSVHISAVVCRLGRFGRPRNAVVSIFCRTSPTAHSRAEQNQSDISGSWSGRLQRSRLGRGPLKSIGLDRTRSDSVGFDRIRSDSVGFPRLMSHESLLFSHVWLLPHARAYKKISLKKFRHKSKTPQERCRFAGLHASKNVLVRFTAVD